MASMRHFSHFNRDPQVASDQPIAISGKVVIICGVSVIVVICMLYMIWLAWMRNSTVADETNEDILIEMERISTIGQNMDESFLENENHRPIVLTSTIEI